MTPEPARTRCLTIGSSDSGGGAGIQGDIKAATAIGAYCSTVIVGLTAQNTLGVTARHSVPGEIVGAQLDAVLDDIGVDAVKVGTTWSAEVITLIADRLEGATVPIVVDPVLITAAGTRIGADDAGLDLLRTKLIPMATVITPNSHEARLITGLHAERHPRFLAEALLLLGAKAVVITDVIGLGQGENSVSSGGDWVFDGEDHHELTGLRSTSGCYHGAGCAHSCVLAVLLGRGVPLVEAARQALDLVSCSVQFGARDIGRGVHPVDMRAGASSLVAAGDFGE